MALTDEGGNNGMIMPVAPMYSGGYGNGCGFGGDWGSWIILFLIFGMFGMGGWGNGFGGFGGGFDFPWLLNGQNGINNNLNSRFDNLGVTNQLSGIQTSLTNGFANAEVAACNRAADAMQTAYSNQIASMNQNFANQQALDARLYAMQSQQADCCCENRLATCQTQNLVQVEAANTRAAGVADTQKILDKLCQLELDGVKAQVEAKNDRISELQTQLNMANLAASQAAQNTLISQGFANEVDALYNRLNSCPVPTTPVYGRTPIFTCNQNQGCGCGNNGLAFA